MRIDLVTSAPLLAAPLQDTGRTCARQGPAKFLGAPDDHWREGLVTEMTPEQLAVMFGPYSNHRGEVPHLAVAEDGTVAVEDGRAW